MEARINPGFPLGLTLAIIGGIGIGLGRTAWLAEPGGLGSLLADFVFGVMTGAGVGLAICALLRQRKNRMKPTSRPNSGGTGQGSSRGPSLRSATAPRAAGGETR